MAFGCAALVMVMNPPACLYGQRHTNHGFFFYFALLCFTFFIVDLKVALSSSLSNSSFLIKKPFQTL